MAKLTDLERAVTRPATQYTDSAWGAEPDEPLHLFPRALRRTLLELDVPHDLADAIVDTGEGGKGDGGKRVGGKGGGGKGKRKR